MNSQYFVLQTDVPKVKMPLFNSALPETLDIRFQGESSGATFFAPAPAPMAMADEEEDFSTATYVFFHIGWTFLLIAVGFMIASSILALPWVGVVAVVSLLICGIGFRKCLLHAEHGFPRDSQAGH